MSLFSGSWRKTLASRPGSTLCVWVSECGPEDCLEKASRRSSRFSLNWMNGSFLDRKQPSSSTSAISQIALLFELQFHMIYKHINRLEPRRTLFSRFTESSFANFIPFSTLLLVVLVGLSRDEANKLFLGQQESSITSSVALFFCVAAFLACPKVPIDLWFLSWTIFNHRPCSAFGGDSPPMLSAVNGVESRASFCPTGRPSPPPASPAQIMEKCLIDCRVIVSWSFLAPAKKGRGKRANREMFFQ